MNLGDTALALLKDAGWSPGRRVDVSEAVRRLRAVGFEVSEAACEFLEKFSLLRISHLPSIEMDGQEIFCWTQFDPSRVCTERDAEVANRCAGLAGTSLCPVGTDGFHLTIYIAGDGRFFAGMDASLYSYSPDIDGLFSSMAEGVRPRHIADWIL
ncbi:SUKH-3 domain-containing protein [Streptomyces sp. NPDC051014]|uniref:SUKH-3 domain-containing protein n=1 Tax=Streptomyces sp. NPDC051014 TaxID=3155751 RepID=UPI0033E09355